LPQRRGGRGGAEERLRRSRLRAQRASTNFSSVLPLGMVHAMSRASVAKTSWLLARGAVPTTRALCGSASGGSASGANCSTSSHILRSCALAPSSPSPGSESSDLPRQLSRAPTATACPIAKSDTCSPRSRPVRSIQRGVRTEVDRVLDARRHWKVPADGGEAIALTSGPTITSSRRGVRMAGASRSRWTSAAISRSAS
jgi:hypothetical protein